MKFRLESTYKPSGDQPEAIDGLCQALQQGVGDVTLLGVTGSGKTFTMANVIEKLQRPALILSHNKTLAAQLYGEFKSFFPSNAVEYFVSYYDYYQPEAYLPTTDTYIEKDLSINDQIDKLRLSAASALMSGRRDVIVVSSVSCLYGIGNPEDFHAQSVLVKRGEPRSLTRLLYHLVDANYSRTEVDFKRGTFRVRGDTVDVFLGGSDEAVRIEFFGDEVESLSLIDPVTGARIEDLDEVPVFPATNFVTTRERSIKAVSLIQDDLKAQIDYFNEIGKGLEAKRLQQRVENDLEMIKEMGYCPGIENYSRYLDGRKELNCSDQTAADVDKEVMKVLASCYEEAKEIIKAHLTTMDRLAEHLISKETISGKEFMRIYREVEGLSEPTEEEKNQSRLRIYATRPESARVGESSAESDNAASSSSSMQSLGGLGSIASTQQSDNKSDLLGDLNSSSQSGSVASNEPKKPSAIDLLSSRKTSSDIVAERSKTKSSFDEAMNDAHNWMSGQSSYSSNNDQTSESQDTSKDADTLPSSDGQAVADTDYVQRPSTLYGSDANKGKDDKKNEPDPMDILTRQGGFDSARDSRYIWANQPENLWSNEKKDDSEDSSKQSGGRFSHVPDDFDSRSDKSDDGSDN